MYGSGEISFVVKNLFQITSAIILVGAEALEVYFLCLTAAQFSFFSTFLFLPKWASAFMSFVERVKKVIRDYRSGMYYKPFGRKDPVIIRSPDAMQELSEASELSQRAVYADIFGFEHTMSHADQYFDPNEQTNLRYRLYARAIRVNGLSQVNALLPHLTARCEKTFEKELDPKVPADSSWHSVKIAPLMRDFATGMLGVYFFGKKLAEEPDFSFAMSRYYDDTVLYMGASQIVPTFMQSWVHNFITKKRNALNILFARLHLALNKERDGWGEDEALKKITLLHNMSEASAESKYWNYTLVIQAIIGIWFAASHQPWINLHFAFLELCARPEYIDMIRHEIESQKTLDYESIAQLPILDSFIKESVRTNPLDRVAIRRKALKPYTFSNNGPHVALGQIACVPAWDIMHNDAKYSNPDVFDGLRFLKTIGQTSSTSYSSATSFSLSSLSSSSSTTDQARPNEPMRGTTFTDASKDFPIWGLGSKVCPGRWHASLVMKLALVHLILRYDFRLREQDSISKHKWFWETFQMPCKQSMVEFRRRVL